MIFLHLLLHRQKPYIWIICHPYRGLTLVSTFRFRSLKQISLYTMPVTGSFIYTCSLDFSAEFPLERRAEHRNLNMINDVEIFLHEFTNFTLMYASCFGVNNSFTRVLCHSIIDLLPVSTKFKSLVTFFNVSFYNRFQCRGFLLISNQNISERSLRK